MKSLKGSDPKYLQELFQYGRDGLRSSYDPAIILKVKRTKCKTFADRSFSVAGSKLWNKPYNTRSAVNLDSFKSKLKAYMFRELHSIRLDKSFFQNPRKLKDIINTDNL